MLLARLGTARTVEDKGNLTRAFPELTVREREILILIAQHLTNPGIAARLSLSPKTVRNVASSIFNKLRVTDRAEAILRGREAGLGRFATYPSRRVQPHESVVEPKTDPSRDDTRPAYRVPLAVRTPDELVSRLGFEPRTRGLKVPCSDR